MPSSTTLDLQIMWEQFLLPSTACPSSNKKLQDTLNSKKSLKREQASKPDSAIAGMLEFIKILISVLMSLMEKNRSMQAERDREAEMACLRKSHKETLDITNTEAEIEAAMMAMSRLDMVEEDSQEE
jgi:hypothetical protein